MCWVLLWDDAGDFEAGRAALEESSRISDELGLRYMAQWSKRNLGHLELAAGDPAAAERVLRDSWEVLVEMGLDSSLGETAVPLAEALHAQGRDEDANETLKAVKDEWASGDASIAAPRLAVRARLQAADGFTRVALQTAERGLRVVRRTDLLCLQADMLLAHAEVARLAGEYDAAAESAAEALRISEEKGYAVGSAARANGDCKGMRAPADREYRGLPLSELLDQVSSAEPMPGAGYCAAVTLEMAAGLVAMAARASRADWGEGRGAAAQANTLRDRIAPLAERNLDAYREAVALLGGAESAGDESLRDALARAAGVPLEIAEVAVDVAALAAVVAERGNQAMRADAVSAALLAEAAARAAATLVEVNLGTTSSDERVARARDLAGSATAAAQRARHTLV